MAETSATTTQSPWLKKVLVPFWLIQLSFTSMLLGGMCYLVMSVGMSA